MKQMEREARKRAEAERDCALARVQLDRQQLDTLRLQAAEQVYSVYLLYWYKSTNTDAGVLSSAPSNKQQHTKPQQDHPPGEALPIPPAIAALQACSAMWPRRRQVPAHASRVLPTPHSTRLCSLLLRPLEIIQFIMQTGR